MSIDRRNAFIDVLRGVSILLVLLHHFNISYPLCNTSLAGLLGWDFVHAVVRNGNYGVTVFFVISGYLITSNARSRWGCLGNIPIATFYILRAARLVPCIVLLLLTVNGLALTGIAIFQNRAPMGIPVSYALVNLASVTFWMNVLVVSRGWVNYALCILWSLSVEEVFYFAFPLLCTLLHRKSLLLIFWIAIIIIGPCYRFTHQGNAEAFLYGYFACFDGISIGCCAALLADRLRWSSRVAWIARMFAELTIIFVYLRWPISQSNIFGVTIIALATAVLLLASHLEIPNPFHGIVRFLSPIRVCGKLSYEIYLFHLVILGLFRTFSPPQSSPGDQRIILLAGYQFLSIGVSMLIAHFYAEPINHYIRRHMVHKISALPYSTL